LIRGPSPSVESKDTSDQGGEESSSCSSNSSGDQEQDHEADSESDHEVESENGDTETLDTYVLARDRERRQNVRPPSRYEDGNFVAYALNVIEDLEVQEPKSYTEAMRSREKKLWKQAAEEEMESHRKNRTWDLIDRPTKAKLVGCR